MHHILVPSLTCVGAFRIFPLFRTYKQCFNEYHCTYVFLYCWRYILLKMYEAIWKRHCFAHKGCLYAILWRHYKRRVWAQGQQSLACQGSQGPRYQGTSRKVEQADEICARYYLHDVKRANVFLLQIRWQKLRKIKTCWIMLLITVRSQVFQWLKSVLSSHTSHSKGKKHTMI